MNNKLQAKIVKGIRGSVKNVYKTMRYKLTVYLPIEWLTQFEGSYVYILDELLEKQWGLEDYSDKKYRCVDRYYDTEKARERAIKTLIANIEKAKNDIVKPVEDTIFIEL